MLRISEKHIEDIIEHAKAGLPNEACGLIAGELQGNIKRIREVYLLSNIDASAEHFSMDPKEQFKALADLRRLGYVLLGNFHSHPSTPARPSNEDITLAFDPALSYLVVSLMEKEPKLKSFRIMRGAVLEEDIAVLDDDEETEQEASKR